MFGYVSTILGNTGFLATIFKSEIDAFHVSLVHTMDNKTRNLLRSDLYRT